MIRWPGVDGLGREASSYPGYFTEVIYFIMGQLTLSRKPDVFINDIIRIIFSGLWVVGSYRGKSYLFWIWSTALVLFLISFCIKLLFPEVAIKDDKVCFFQHKFKFWPYVCLPVYEIESIVEDSREVGGFARLIPVPTFIFLMKNGNKIEYFPNEITNTRLGIVRTFLDNIPGIPPVCKMTCEKNE